MIGEKITNDNILDPVEKDSLPLSEIERFIFVSDDVQPVDALMVLGSPWIELIAHAGELYHRGIAPKIIACGKYGSRAGQVNVDKLPNQYRKDYRTESEMIKSILTEYFDVPEQAILEESESTNTRENILYGMRALKDSSTTALTIGICCQAFHARRALMTFESVAPECECRIYPSNTQGISKGNWSRSEYGRERVMGELERCRRYFSRSRM